MKLRKTTTRRSSNVILVVENIVRFCAGSDRLCGLVVRVSGYRYSGLGFDSRRYQIF